MISMKHHQKERVKKLFRQIIDVTEKESKCRGGGKPELSDEQLKRDNNPCRRGRCRGGHGAEVR